MMLELENDNMAGGNAVEKWQRIYSLERFINANTNVIKRFEVIPSVNDSIDDEEEEEEEEERNKGLSGNDIFNNVDPNNVDLEFT